MPIPRKGQSKEDYMKVCPSIVINEGTTKDYKQAYAICESMWEQHLKKSKGELLAEEMSEELKKIKGKDDKCNQE